MSLSVSVDSGATLLSLPASPKSETAVHTVLCLLSPTVALRQPSRSRPKAPVSTLQTCVLAHSAVDAVFNGLVPDASLE